MQRPVWQQRYGQRDAGDRTAVPPRPLPLQQQADGEVTEPPPQRLLGQTGGLQGVAEHLGRPVERLRAGTRRQAPAHPRPAGLVAARRRGEVGGRWKAVVVGSYERGDRTLTAQRLSELAAFYRVPITELLPQPRSEVVPRRAAGLVVDLQQVLRVPAEQREPLARYAARIQTQRGDYNGQLLSLRAEDLRSLCVLYEVRPQDVAERLATWGLLAPRT